MRPEKQQFNTYLTPDLIARVKHRAIDEQLSLSDFMAHVLSAYLKGIAVNDSTPPLKLQPMIHVEDMRASVAFYEALGATLLVGSRDGDWAQLRIGGAEIGLLAHPANPEQNEGQVEMNFESDEPLADVEACLQAAGVTIVRGAADEAFGEQLQIEAPGGMLVKINRIDPATFA